MRTDRRYDIGSDTIAPASLGGRELKKGVVYVVIRSYKSRKNGGGGQAKRQVFE